jgi:hypothetical protein
MADEPKPRTTGSPLSQDVGPWFPVDPDKDHGMTDTEIDEFLARTVESPRLGGTPEEGSQ